MGQRAEKKLFKNDAPQKRGAGWPRTGDSTGTEQKKEGRQTGLANRVSGWRRGHLQVFNSLSSQVKWQREGQMKSQVV